MSGIISRDRSEENGLVRSERYLLRFMAEEPSLFEQVSRVLEPGDFSSELDRKLAGLLFGQLSCGAANPAAIADDFAEEDEHGIVVRIFNDEVPHPEERREFSEFITDLVIRIKKNSLMNASENDDDGAVDPLEQIRKKREEVEQLDNIRITLP